MFTGIISNIGTLTDLIDGKILKARIMCSYDYQSVSEGGSIAHDGVCLTIMNKVQHEKAMSYEVEISNETLSKTNIGERIGGWVIGKEINLEKSLRLGDELGGHIVTGHIDGVAKLVNLENVDKSTQLTFDVPDHLTSFIAPKGSITLNGTSLTVNEINGSLFKVNLIPHTRKVTTWKHCKLGELFNVEIDLLARYLARLYKPMDKNENI